MFSSAVLVKSYSPLTEIHTHESLISHFVQHVISNMLYSFTFRCKKCGMRFQLIMISQTQNIARYCPQCGDASIEPHEIILC
jgi:predicted Zn-ribbon and HTH transcriptional regulator